LYSRYTCQNPNLLSKFGKTINHALQLKNNPKFSPRTKHIALKYHHLQKPVITQSNPDGLIVIDYCSTDGQIVDKFTKPVRGDIFQAAKFATQLVARTSCHEGV
jgi:hypothetical protein